MCVDFLLQKFAKMCFCCNFIAFVLFLPIIYFCFKVCSIEGRDIIKRLNVDGTIKILHHLKKHNFLVGATEVS